MDDEVATFEAVFPRIMDYVNKHCELGHCRSVKVHKLFVVDDSVDDEALDLLSLLLRSQAIRNEILSAEAKITFSGSGKNRQLIVESDSKLTTKHFNLIKQKIESKIRKRGGYNLDISYPEKKSKFMEDLVVPLTTDEQPSTIDEKTHTGYKLIRYLKPEKNHIDEAEAEANYQTTDN